MRLLQFCFALMVFGISAKAQDTSKFFYHISFYKWEWDYACGFDTIILYDFEGNFLRDTIIHDTTYYPLVFGVKYPIKKSFYSSHFEVTSLDEKIKYEVKGFDALPIYSAQRDIEMHCPGSGLSKMIDDAFHDCKPNDEIVIKKIRIFNPVSQKEISIPGIIIYVE